MQLVPETWKWWKMQSENGRQQWRYQGPETADWEALFERDFGAESAANPNSADRVYRNQKAEVPPQSPPQNTGEYLQTAIRFYQALQQNDGNWSGDYGGPMFLLPGLIAASHITETPFPEPHKALMARYMLNRQNTDGGWGLHIEDHSTMFGTVMQYVALRILGTSKENPALEKALGWIKSNGGTLSIPSWGKFYLASLNLFDWKAVNTLLPELWLLPRSLPLHPGNYWCHTRMVYLPMGYIQGKKFQKQPDALMLELRRELFDEPFETIAWKKARWKCCPKDIYHKPSFLLKVLYSTLNIYEGIHLQSLRKKALDFAYRYIQAEDRHTHYINIGPVNQAINSMAVYFTEGKSEAFQKHVERWYDYLWIAEDGMKMNGYNGSQFWDTLFATRAMLEADREHEFTPVLQKAYRFFDRNQLLEEVESSSYFFRNRRKGGWPFSTAEQGWPITDCSAEGMAIALKLHQKGIIPENQQTITLERMKDSVDTVLSFQNPNGGWASYEKKRGPSLMEKINPSEVFGDIMVDYPYVECSSASIQGLVTFHAACPEYRADEVRKAIRKGEKFLMNQQRPDGSFLGCWAVCFTYGTWFGVEGLLAAGHKPYSSGQVSPNLIKACDFLVSKQRSDGAWGEHFRSCVEKTYIEHPEGQTVNTAWALMALMAARYPDKSVIDRGIQYLKSQMEPNGDFPQQAIMGVFNFNCMISYTSYRNIFPIWALGRYRNLYEG